MFNTSYEVLFSGELKFCLGNSCMPGPRQPDHKLNKDGSVIDKFSRVFVEVQNIAASQLACKHNTCHIQSA